MVLDQIIRRTEERVAGMPPVLEGMIPEQGRSLSHAIRSSTGKNPVIAELKYASPSRGRIRRILQPEHLAQEFIAGGCAALSVLTEPYFFAGDTEYLRRIHPISTVPILRKDFIIHTKQLVETRYLGADAVLLIACVLGENLSHMVHQSVKLGLEPLIETHCEEEVECALKTGAELIGVNNRNLRTMRIDLKTTMRLSEMIRDEGRLVITESGMCWPYDIKNLKNYCDAFLIGSAIMASKNPRKKLEGFVYA